MKNIGIIGAGRIGNALEKILAKAGHSVSKWDKDPQRCGPADIGSVVNGADFLFLCVPSWGFREAVESVKPNLDPKTIIVSLTKGMEETSLKTADALLEEILPKNQAYIILGGPLIAENIAKDEIGIGVAASKKKQNFESLAELFKGTNIFLEYSPNPASVALAGVLKNIYATLIGIAEGIGVNGNFSGYLISKSIQEMVKISLALCGEKETALGTAGVGDLIATSFSENSKNRSSGIEIAKSNPIPKSEGIVSLPLINKKLGKDAKDFKLLSALTDIIENKKDPKTELMDLLS